MHTIREWLIDLAFLRIGIVPLVGMVLCVGMIVGLCIAAVRCQPDE
jgi:hypothetical protein